MTESENNINPIGEIIADKFKIFKKIDEGSFGQIYLAYKVQSGTKKSKNSSEKIYAVKIENSGIQNKSQLVNEANVLAVVRGQPGFSRLSALVQKNSRSYLVQELFDKNLEQLLKSCNGLFSLKTVLMFLEQAFCRLEVMHIKNIIHRDVKPENFMTGLGKNKHMIFLIDFGLSKIIKKKPESHLQLAEGSQTDQNKIGMMGSICFSSINAQSGYEQSFRDDLESLAYVAIYFLKGQMPWSGIEGFNMNDTFLQVLQAKKKYTPEEICKDIPKEFAELLSYAKKLSPYRKPDYQLLKFQFRKLFLNHNYNYKCNFDWEKTLSIYSNYRQTPKKCQNKIQSAQLTKTNSGSTQLMKVSPNKSDLTYPEAECSKRRVKCSIDNGLSSETSQNSEKSQQNSIFYGYKIDNKEKSVNMDGSTPQNSILQINKTQENINFTYNSTKNMQLNKNNSIGGKNYPDNLSDYNKIFNYDIICLQQTLNSESWQPVPPKINIDSEINIIEFNKQPSENYDEDLIDENCPISCIIQNYYDSPKISKFSKNQQYTEVIDC